MKRRDSSPYQSSQRQLKGEVIALGLALTGASLIAAFDFGTSASAAEGVTEPTALTVSQAVDAAGEQGMDPDRIDGALPVYDPAYGRMVWQVHGDDRAVLDASTGDLLEISFE